MATVGAIATAISSTLEAAGIRTTEYLPDTFTPPIALVAIETIDYHSAFARQTLHEFTVFLVLARGSDRAGFEAMESYMSNVDTLSVRQILEADQSLGGVTATCKVVSSGPPLAITISNVPYISVPFHVEVHSGD